MNKNNGVQIHFWLTEAEAAQLDRRMRLCGMPNRSEYLRKTALNGYLFNLKGVSELIYEIRRSADALNRIADSGHASDRVLSEMKEQILKAEQKIDVISDLLLQWNDQRAGEAFGDDKNHFSAQGKKSDTRKGV